MEGTLRCTLGSQAQHAHYLKDHTRSIQQSTCTHTKHSHNIQQQHSNHTKTYYELFHQTIHKQCQTRNTQYKDIHQQSNAQIQGYSITLTKTQVQEAIKLSKNNNSQGPDILNIMLKTALNTNIITHIWKLAKIVPIQKPNKNIDKSISYRPVCLLSVIAKKLEKSLLPYITESIPNTHATRVQNTTLDSDGTTNSNQHR